MSSILNELYFCAVRTLFKRKIDFKNIIEGFGENKIKKSSMHFILLIIFIVIIFIIN